MQIIALPESGRVNLNVREGGYLKYSLFVLSMALLKLFWNYFGIILVIFPVISACSET